MGDDPVLYEIRVNGHLGPTLLTAFPAFAYETVSGQQGAQTVLTGPVPDIAALYGVIFQLEALGLELVAVQRVAPCSREEPSSSPGHGPRPAPPGLPRPLGDAP
ncbi:hypothetical protein ABZ926_12645 [Streptomyces litmocidini]|uniref:hypothetical protein n=1 Tax=Streptomyces litmocidini TaxID=67318 RepID=UPI0033E2FFA1